MKKEYDFSKGERGKFYKPDVRLNIPVYLEPDLAKAISERAQKNGTDLTVLVNEWLRRDIQSASKVD